MRWRDDCPSRGVWRCAPLVIGFALLLGACGSRSGLREVDGPAGGGGAGGDPVVTSSSAGGSSSSSSSSTSSGAGGSGGGGEPLEPLSALDISAGGLHSCAALPSGQGVCWGQNFYGQLGIEANEGLHGTPALVPGLEGVVALTLGFYHGCARLADATVSCWGENSAGQLGTGEGGGSFLQAAPVLGLGPVAEVTAGG